MINKKIFFSLLLLAAGFLSAAAQKSPQDMDRFIDALMIQFGRISINKGMLIENIVAQQLKSLGHSLFYYIQKLFLILTIVNTTGEVKQILLFTIL